MDLPWISCDQMSLSVCHCLPLFVHKQINILKIFFFDDITLVNVQLVGVWQMYQISININKHEQTKVGSPLEHPSVSHLHIWIDDETERTFKSDKCTMTHCFGHQIWENIPKRQFSRKYSKNQKKIFDQHAVICLLIFVCIQAQDTNWVIYPWDLDGFQCFKVYFCQMTSTHHVLIKYKQTCTNKSKIRWLQESLSVTSPLTYWRLALSLPVCRPVFVDTSIRSHLSLWEYISCLRKSSNKSVKSWEYSWTCPEYYVIRCYHLFVIVCHCLSTIKKYSENVLFWWYYSCKDIASGCIELTDVM